MIKASSRREWPAHRLDRRDDLRDTKIEDVKPALGPALVCVKPAAPKAAAVAGDDDHHGDAPAVKTAKQTAKQTAKH